LSGKRLSGKVIVREPSVTLLRDDRVYDVSFREYLPAPSCAARIRRPANLPRRFPSTITVTHTVTPPAKASLPNVAIVRDILPSTSCRRYVHAWRVMEIVIDGRRPYGNRQLVYTGD